MIDGPMSAFAHVTAVRAYPDTIDVLFRRAVDRQERNRLHSLNGGRVRVVRRTAGHALLRFQQPSDRVLAELASLDQRSLIDIRTDVSVDFLTKTSGRAEEVASALDNSVVLIGGSPTNAEPYLGTSYWANGKGLARNLVLYADRPSKTGLGHCAHLELRFLRSASVRSAGLSLEALRGEIDILGLLRKYTRLIVIDRVKEARRMDWLAANNLRRFAQRRHAIGGLEQVRGDLKCLFCRMTQTAEGIPSSLAEVRGHEYWHRLPMLRNAIVRVPWEAVVPSVTWSLLNVPPTD